MLDDLLDLLLVLAQEVGLIVEVLQKSSPDSQHAHYEALIFSWSSFFSVVSHELDNAVNKGKY